ncbi:MAG: 16S rRNA (adenine(1518)-N(6)/adenine(1519)-N(6))-dimethyltransferase RsmA [Bacillota bacterium]|nr:16S rRNA (adenine(1518)-N(6)/adenine(1519)-N(6))-dimethyltransferase [Bacillota bacterium]HWR56749.1 16S rRNA (adenine(1518)-N(6)/adenine(1519)-N(6))-dimethyltransferase RsmA [Negativicutes bacterium]
MNIRPQIVRSEVTHAILKRFGLKAHKKLGQNFLINPRVLSQIIQAADIHAGDDVLEIGPGIGTLTQGLADAGALVTAVELDSGLLPVLAKTLEGYENITIIHGDILKLDLPALLQGRQWKVVANLPYYITTPIIMTLLEQRLPLSSIVSMVQKEVAERMIAKPGGKDYGALSVAVQYYTSPEIITQVPAHSFVPAPAVESAVIKCTVRDTPPVQLINESFFFKVVRGAFGQRRKTLLNALGAAALDLERKKIEEGLLAANIIPSRRGETLSLEEFAVLTNVLWKFKAVTN